MRDEVSILTQAGRKYHYTQQMHESGPEFNGRWLCEFEEAVTGKRGPLPEGYRYVVWHHRGHPLRKFYATGCGDPLESTGERYQNRSRRVPGYGMNESEARAWLGL